jgi:hypothetical protein
MACRQFRLAQANCIYRTSSPFELRLHTGRPSQPEAAINGYSILVLLMLPGRKAFVCATHIGSSLRIGLVPESGVRPRSVAVRVQGRPRDVGPRGPAGHSAGPAGIGGERSSLRELDGILTLDLLAPRNHR